MLTAEHLKADGECGTVPFRTQPCSDRSRGHARHIHGQGHFYPATRLTTEHNPRRVVLRRQAGAGGPQQQAGTVALEGRL